VSLEAVQSVFSQVAAVIGTVVVSTLFGATSHAELELVKPVILSAETVQVVSKIESSPTPDAEVPVFTVEVPKVAEAQAFEMPNEGLKVDPTPVSTYKMPRAFPYIKGLHG